MVIVGRVIVVDLVEGGFLRCLGGLQVESRRDVCDVCVLVQVGGG